LVIRYRDKVNSQTFILRLIFQNTPQNKSKPVHWTSLITFFCDKTQTVTANAVTALLVNTLDCSEVVLRN